MASIYTLFCFFLAKRKAEKTDTIFDNMFNHVNSMKMNQIRNEKKKKMRRRKETLLFIHSPLIVVVVVVFYFFFYAKMSFWWFRWPSEITHFHNIYNLIHFQVYQTNWRKYNKVSEWNDKYMCHRVNKGNNDIATKKKLGDHLGLTLIRHYDTAIFFYRFSIDHMKAMRSQN